MRDPNRIFEFCAELMEIWSKVPDLRFNQLIVGFFSSMERNGRDPFYIEDEETIKQLKAYVEQVTGGK